MPVFTSFSTVPAKILLTVKNSSVTTKHLYLILTFRSHHEIFIRRSWYSVLPSLDATISCCIKKAVIGVTELITALVSIHSSMTFLPSNQMNLFLEKYFVPWQNPNPGRMAMKWLRVSHLTDLSLHGCFVVIGSLMGRTSNPLSLEVLFWNSQKKRTGEPSFNWKMALKPELGSTE